MLWLIKEEVKAFGWVIKEKRKHNDLNYNQDKKIREGMIKQ